MSGAVLDAESGSCRVFLRLLLGLCIQRFGISHHRAVQAVILLQAEAGEGLASGRDLLHGEFCV